MKDTIINWRAKKAQERERIRAAKLRYRLLTMIAFAAIIYAFKVLCE